MFTRNIKYIITILFSICYIIPIKSQTLKGSNIFEIIDKVPKKRGMIIHNSQKIMKEQRIVALSDCPFWTVPDCDTLYIIHYSDFLLSQMRIEQIITSKYMYELHYNHKKLEELSVYSYPDYLDEFWDVVLNWNTNILTKWYDTTGHDMFRIEAMRLIRVKDNKYKYSIYDFYDNSNRDDSMNFWKSIYVQKYQ